MAEEASLTILPHILAVEGNPPLEESKECSVAISGGRRFIEKLKKAAAGTQRYYRTGKRCASRGLRDPPAPIRPRQHYR